MFTREDQAADSRSYNCGKTKEDAVELSEFLFLMAPIFLFMGMLVRPVSFKVSVPLYAVGGLLFGFALPKETGVYLCGMQLYEALGSIAIIMILLLLGAFHLYRGRGITVPKEVLFASENRNELLGIFAWTIAIIGVWGLGVVQMVPALQNEWNNSGLVSWHGLAYVGVSVALVCVEIVLVKMLRNEVVTCWQSSEPAKGPTTNEEVAQ